MDLKENVLYKITCDNRTYKLCCWRKEGVCCRGCINRRRRTWYDILEYDDKVKAKYPNWKLVSKNKKQWMKKPLKFKVDLDLRFTRTYTKITW